VGALGRLLAALLAVASTAWAAEPQAVVPGKAVGWPHPAYGEEVSLSLFVPESYHDPDNAGRAWPLVLWFHGTNGRPTTQLLREVGAGENFVIVGMTYLQSGRFQYTPEGLGKEMAAYRQVVRDLQKSKQIRIDPRRIYVGGFSKGGWLSALFFEKDPLLAGAMVMGGGVFDRPDSATERFATVRPVYVGIGSLDPNLAVSRKAEHFLTSLGTRVTLDIWPGVGHQYPRGEDQQMAMRQWLAVEAAAVPPTREVGQELRDEAIEWFGDELRKLKNAWNAEPPRDAVEVWLALEELAGKPFVSIIDAAAREQAKEFLAELRSDPRVAEEMQVRDRYLQIQRKEYVNLTIERLATCAAEYKKLWGQHPGAHFGELARQSYERTQQLLRDAGLPER
jgi:predicted esterase